MKYEIMLTEGPTLIIDKVTAVVFEAGGDVVFYGDDGVLCGVNQNAFIAFYRLAEEAE